MQLEEVRKVLTEKRGAEKFLVYFQAYTSTFAGVAQLKTQFNEALTDKDVVGIVVGTRPDCISQIAQ